ncbi:MAG TPA: S8 family peptidase [Acidimicrobiia bacterium]|nr:S8 family peptidase [Acidimicrobiia bacterium]
MRVSSRAFVTSVAAFALAVGWIGASSASARPASDSPGARHIVVLRDHVDPDAAARDHGRRHGAEVQGIYRHALKGYVAVLEGKAAADVARDPRVAFVELDGTVSVHGSQTIGPNGPWGLDRIDDATGLDENFTYNNEGSGVTAYIIDTGIQYGHAEFEGRAVKGADFAPGNKSGADCDGHGTHVAGTVGGKTYGVAKKVKLVSVRVLDCKGSGTYSAIIAGIDWVTKNHGPKSVANMSLGGGASAAIDTAVTNSISAGVTYVVAAGNGNKAGVAQNACNYSPAKVPTAITIGATDSTDTKSSWSNYGPCVDFFAPGVNVLSAGYSKTSTTATAMMSGTSMASPHVAGVVALYLSSLPAGSTPAPAEVQSALAFSTNVVKSAGTGTPFPYVIFTNGL